METKSSLWSSDLHGNAFLSSLLEDLPPDHLLLPLTYRWRGKNTGFQARKVCALNRSSRFTVQPWGSY